MIEVGDDFALEFGWDGGRDERLGIVTVLLGWIEDSSGECGAEESIEETMMIVVMDDSGGLDCCKCHSGRTGSVLSFWHQGFLCQVLSLCNNY